uniref:MYND-type domain-containing protein n=1 Tax=Chromera velia CCMP2878 TaxID=1169474 RepID=A0A0G4FFG7_9ALVE|eukprot:Cvel_16714.t1-p1 / transcript=Cvel_16714.t1 / gene=Cvel_16714 / organism=Chromera_velia_CCMP2878 / gene_product=hypothetical protein / transcript_product=hypothetical protein / location=Cvel_scaffold1299:2228-3856(+) / protein_length=543 / sequence_SO=supercontig / SO=protein_coding / is_pseudo=false
MAESSSLNSLSAFLRGIQTLQPWHFNENLAEAKHAHLNTFQTAMENVVPPFRPWVADIRAQIVKFLSLKHCVIHSLSEILQDPRSRTGMRNVSMGLMETTVTLGNEAEAIGEAMQTRCRDCVLMQCSAVPGLFSSALELFASFSRFSNGVEDASLLWVLTSLCCMGALLLSAFLIQHSRLRKLIWRSEVFVGGLKVALEKALSHRLVVSKHTSCLIQLLSSFLPSEQRKVRRKTAKTLNKFTLPEEITRVKNRDNSPIDFSSIIRAFYRHNECEHAGSSLPPLLDLLTYFAVPAELEKAKRAVFLSKQAAADALELFNNALDKLSSDTNASILVCGFPDHMNDFSFELLHAGRQKKDRRVYRGILRVETLQLCIVNPKVEKIVMKRKDEYLTKLHALAEVFLPDPPPPFLDLLVARLECIVPKSRAPPRPPTAAQRRWEKRFPGAALRRLRLSSLPSVAAAEHAAAMGEENVSASMRTLLRRREQHFLHMTREEQNEKYALECDAKECNVKKPNLQVCPTCHLTAYCCRACQLNDWTHGGGEE